MHDECIHACIHQSAPNFTSLGEIKITYTQVVFECGSVDMKTNLKVSITQERHYKPKVIIHLELTWHVWPSQLAHSGRRDPHQPNAIIPIPQTWSMETYSAAL